MNDAPNPEATPASKSIGDAMKAYRLSGGKPNKLDRILGDLGKLSADAGIKIPKPDTGMLAAFASVPKVGPGVTGATLAAAARTHDEFMESTRSDFELVAESRRAERKRQLDWQNGVLEQQRLTVEALKAMADAQKTDRRINIWILLIAAATLLVGIAGVLVGLLK